MDLFRELNEKLNRNSLHIDVTGETFKRKSFVEKYLRLKGGYKDESEAGEDARNRANLSKEEGGFLDFYSDDEQNLDNITYVMIEDIEDYIAMFLVEIHKNGFGVSYETKEQVNHLLNKGYLSYQDISTALLYFINDILNNIEKVVVCGEEIQLIAGISLLNSIKAGEVKKEDIGDKGTKILKLLEEKNIYSLESLINYFLNNYILK